MNQFTIYHGTLPNGRRKVGVDHNYPSRINKQKMIDGRVLEVHTDIYEVSRREMELQRLHDVKVDATPYHVTYNINKSPEHRAKISAANMGNTRGAGCRGNELSEEHKAKISATLTGRKLSEETKAKMSSPQPKIQCTYCERLIGNTNIKRHLDKCMYKN